MLQIFDKWYINELALRKIDKYDMNKTVATTTLAITRKNFDESPAILSIFAFVENLVQQNVHWYTFRCITWKLCTSKMYNTQSIWLKCHGYL